MTKGAKPNLPASIKQRLSNFSEEIGESLNLVALRYANERFLYRLSKSKHADRLILKGATLLAHWMDAPHRPTKDIDFLGHGDSSDEAILSMVSDILLTEVEDDGLIFNVDAISVREIREDVEYGGLRVKFSVSLGKMVIPMQIDIGFGDAPGAVEVVTMQTILGQPAPKVRAYQKEVVVAEKFHAMVEKGIANSRMKDYVDIWLLSKEFDFTSKALSAAIKATFASRGTTVPFEAPVALTEAFSSDAAKIAQMRSFISDKTNLEAGSVELAEIVDDLRDFLMPVVHQISGGQIEDKAWTAGGPWENIN